MQLTSKRKTALIAFLAVDFVIVLALVMLFLLRGERQSEDELREIGVTIYPDPRPVSDFRLLDQAGDFFTKADLEGDWNLIFFGFTNCPDICPITMAELKQFYESEGLEGLAKPRIFLVTVDPLRDNPASMAAYLENYHPDFIGLSGDPGAIAQLASELYVAYGEAPEGASVMSHDHADPVSQADVEEANYLIEHSGHIAVIDPEGEYIAVMRAPHRDRDLVTAYREIVR